MDVVLVGSWMLFSERIRPWTSSCLGHGCSSQKRSKPWTSSWLDHGCSSQNGLDHGRHLAWAMDALLRNVLVGSWMLFSERSRPWTSSWLGHGKDHDLFLYTDSAGRLNKASQWQKQQAPLCESLQKAPSTLTKRLLERRIAKQTRLWQRLLCRGKGVPVWGLHKSKASRKQAPPIHGGPHTT